MLTRLALAAGLLAGLGGCAEVPVALVGAGLGWAASVNNLGAELLKRQPPAEEHPAIEEMPTPP